jgi:hypothetical protein
MTTLNHGEADDDESDSIPPWQIHDWCTLPIFLSSIVSALSP